MKTINVPSVAGSRTLADKLVHAADLVAQEPVLIDSRHLDVNTESFVSQLVKRVAEAKPSEVEVVGGGQDWIAEVQREAKLQKLRVTVRDLASA